MKVGLDAFTIREISTDPVEQLDFARKNGFDGVQFDEACYLGTDGAKLHDITAYAKQYDLYTSPSVDVINPLVHKISADENAKMVEAQIIAYAKVGWHELRTRTGGLDERGEAHRNGAVAVMKKLRPVLTEHQSRINFEDHGECTTFDLVRMVESVGDDIMGINLDLANTLVHAEDPYLAVKRCAPYVHSTHAKDGILYFTPNGVTRQGRPAGQGVVDWDKILPVLHRHNPGLALSVEDHKWLFEVKIFDQEWIDDHPDLTAYELGQFVQKAYLCTEKILKKELPDPAEYEKTPFAEEMMSRLTFARDYLKGRISALTPAPQ